MILRPSAVLAALLAAAVPAVAAPPAGPPIAPSVADAIASQTGAWRGSLEYRDYQADRWFGIPMAVTITDGGDGVTQIRTADFDDGPKVGIVRITTMSMLGADGTTEYSTAFRKGRVPELSSAQLTLTAWRDPAHWSMRAEERAADDDRPALIRTTFTRDGDTLTSLKEVDFTDDTAEEWLVRNRTTLERAAP